MKSSWMIVVLVIGIAIGVGVVMYGPEYMKPYLPGPAKARGDVVAGKVVAKQMEDGKLLITVISDEGASLVTFTEKVPEVSLLVDQGDEVTLRLRRYEPFVTNPPIDRVRKEEQLTREAKEASSAASAPSPEEKPMKPEAVQPEPKAAPEKAEVKKVEPAKTEKETPQPSAQEPKAEEPEEPKP